MRLGLAQGALTVGKFGRHRFEVEVEGETFVGQYEIDEIRPPMCILTVWYRGKSEVEKLAAHEPDYWDLCAELTLNRIIQRYRVLSTPLGACGAE